MRKQNGITLVALVIIIIVLLILAAVSINLVINNGLLEKAKYAVYKYSDGEIEEQIKLAYLEWQSAQYTGETRTTHAFIQDKLRDVFDDNELTVNENTGIIIATFSNGRVYKYESNLQYISKFTDKKESYVGYYADVNGDGSPDGVIFADLAFSKSGKWGLSDGTYSYTEKTELDEYRISEEKYTEGRFGDKEIITRISKKGEDTFRFYVMALGDINSNTYHWYRRALGNMSDYETATSGNFGTGKKNTEDMIARWDKGSDGGYGAQDNNDMWGLIKTQVAAGWFVPSKGEWVAFADYLAKRTENPLK